MRPVESPVTVPESAILWDERLVRGSLVIASLTPMSVTVLPAASSLVDDLALILETKSVTGVDTLIPVVVQEFVGLE